MAGQHQFDYRLAAFQHPGGAGIDDHPRGYRGNAGGQKRTVAFIFHEAYSASAVGIEVRIMAKRRDLNTGLTGQIKYRHPRMPAYFNAIKCDGNGLQWKPPGV